MESIQKVSNQTNWDGIARVFNYYVSSSTAAYPTEALDGIFFHENWKSYLEYPFFEAKLGDEVTGFSYMRPFHPADSMNHAVVFTYFISPDHTGKGIGKRFLNLLWDEANKMGKSTVLVNISSENTGSINFHTKHGFKKCGCFQSVGQKNGRTFDMIWMQKFLSE